MARTLSDLKKLAKLKSRLQVVEEAITALERLKTEYKGIHGLGPDRFDPILPAARRRRKPDDFRCDLAG
ncbi:MAG: hypothetical protein ABSH09_04765 [Bryobacteraceae bacterium]